MTITIPDDILKQAALTEREALIELACRLYDANRLGLSAAAQLARLDRVGLEIELRKRSLPVWHVTAGDLADDAAALMKLREAP